MNTSGPTIDHLYLQIVRNLLTAPRVGNTRERLNVQITLTDITNNIVSVRGISPAYLFGELLWYFKADNTLSFISQFSSFWNHLSDDGVTCNSAYGFLMMRKHGFDQLQKVIDILKIDPNSRRAKININYPNPNVDTTKDEPCTMSLHFNIRKGELYCTAVMRSNDIWFGFPYDVAFFTELQKYVANQLHVGYGTYTHFAVSMHMYDRDVEKLDPLIHRSAADRPESKPVVWNRRRFYQNIDPLYEAAKTGGKNELMKKLAELRIYKEE